MTQPIVYLARPVHYGMDPYHVHSVERLTMAFMGRGDCKLHIPFPLVGDSLVQRARNTLTDRFLKTACTHMLFIDADISFEPEAVFALLASGAGVVGCAYRKKSLDERRVVSAVLRGDPHPLDAGSQYAYEELDEPSGTLVKGCMEVKQLATGFLMIRRDVIEGMLAEHPEWFCVSGSEQTYGQMEPLLFDCYKDKTRRYLSEDYAFCERWREMGGKVWCYLDATLVHHGDYGYRGNLKSWLTEQALDGFQLPPMDPHATQDIIGVLRGSYDVPVEDVKSVLDIGANIGAFSRWASRRWPEATVNAYEPHPKSYEFLLKNVGDMVIPLNWAVRGESGRGPLFDGGPNAGCASFHDIGEQAAESRMVDFVSANVLTHFDIVKIDTEGCEVEILERLDISKTKAVMLEWHRDSDVPLLEELLREFSITKNQTEPNRGIMKAVRNVSMPK